MANMLEYHHNYATLKARGVGDNIKYIFTHHKAPVKMAGFENVSSVQNAMSIYVAKHSDYGVPDDVRFDQSLSRSKSAIVQLVANNEWDYFVTLTISPDADTDRYNIKLAKKRITEFLSNYARRSGSDSGFKYLLIPELHKDGAIHFHGVFKGINPDDLKVNKYGYWDFVPYVKRFGFCSLGRIKDINACASYMSKYMTKDMLAGQPFERGMHLYFASKGLKKDAVISVGHSNLAYSDFIEAGYEPYDNQFCYKVDCSDISTCINWIMPFGKQFKTGVNIRVNKLSESEKIELKKIQVNRYRNLENIKGTFNLDNLWNLLYKEFGLGLSMYEVYRRRFEDLKKLYNYYEVTELDDDGVKNLQELFNAAFDSKSVDDTPHPDAVTYHQVNLWGDYGG